MKIKKVLVTYFYLQLVAQEARALASGMRRAERHGFEPRPTRYFYQKQLTFVLYDFALLFCLLAFWYWSMERDRKEEAKAISTK